MSHFSKCEPHICFESCLHSKGHHWTTYARFTLLFLLEQRSQSELDLQMIIDEKASVACQRVARDHTFPREAGSLGKVKHAILTEVAFLKLVEHFQENLAPDMEAESK